MREFPSSLSSSVTALFGEDSGSPTARLEDAELLLAYCARNGIEIPSNTLSAILNARHEIETSKVTPATEIALWNALNDLSKAAAPVTVFSLKVNTKLWKVVYGFLFVGVLVSVLWLQFFWFIGTTLTNDLSTLQKQAEIAATALTQVQTKASAAPKGGNAGSQTGQNSQGNSTSDAVDPQQLSVDTPPSGGALDDYINLQDAISAKEHLLTVWVQDAVWLSPIPQATKAPETNTSAANNDVLALAPLLLGGLRLYLLPLLYGLLGAFVYVLRRIAREGELYTGEGDWIRICFGSAAGIGMGLFFGQDAPQLQVFGSIQSTVSSLSPFALAFAGGYSADILFAALDRLVSAFSSAEGTKEDLANMSGKASLNNGRRLTKAGNGTGSVVSGDPVTTPTNGATTNAPRTVGTQDKPAALANPGA